MPHLLFGAARFPRLVHEAQEVAVQRGRVRLGLLLFHRQLGNLLLHGLFALVLLGLHVLQVRLSIRGLRVQTT